MNEQFKFKVSFELVLNEERFPEWLADAVAGQLESTEELNEFEILKVK
jgi:hypothetical protein